MIRNLATLDRDIGQALGRIIQEAFADGLVINKQYSGGGLLADGVDQDIYTESETQNFDLGTRLVIDDRVFRYAKAADNLAAHRGAFCDPQMYWEGDGHMPEAVAGAKVISFDNKNGQAIAASALKDGWVVGIALTDATSIYCMKIKDNKQSDGAGGSVVTCELTLYRGMPHGIEGTNHRSYVYAGIYAGLKQMGGAAYNTNLGGVVCVPVRKITAGRYFWGMTWGIFYCQCGSWGTQIGATVNKRIIGFDGVGAIVYRAGAEDVDIFFQDAGYLLMDGVENQHGAITNGDQLAMLTISP